MNHRTPLHRREASLLWCETLVRRAASCGILFAQPALSHLRLRGRLGSLCLGRGRAAHELVSRWLWSALVLSNASSPAEGLSLSACGRVVMYQERPPPPSVHFCASTFALTRALGLAGWGEETQHASSCCAGCGWLRAHRRAVHRRNLASFVYGRVVACQERPPPPSRLTPLSRGEEAQHAGSWHAGCGQLRAHRRAVHRRRLIAARHKRRPRVVG